MKYNHYNIVELTEYTNLETGENKKYNICVNIKTNLKYIPYDLNQEIILDSTILDKEKYNNGLLDIDNIKLVKEDCCYNPIHIIEYYMKKKLYYVSELLTEDVGDYNPYPTGFRDLRVYEIINGEFKEFYNTEHPMEDYCLDVLKEYLNEISYDKELDEYTFDENDYEFIEL